MQDLFLCFTVGVEQHDRVTCACLSEGDSVGKKQTQGLTFLSETTLKVMNHLRCDQRKHPWNTHTHTRTQHAK